MAGIEEVKKYLAEYGVSVLEFETATPTAEAAAVAVGCTPAEIAKSILLLVGNRPILVVTSGDMKVNSSKLKKAAGMSGKVTLPAGDDVTRYCGYQPGGICPFLLPASLPVFLDHSLKRFSKLYPAAGNAHSAVPIDYRRLQQLTNGVAADLCLPGT